MAEHRDHLRKGEDVNLIVSMIAGGLSGLAARTVTAPLDTIKIRLQVVYNNSMTNSSSQVKNTNLPRLILETYKNEGILGFWKGNVPGSLMYIIYGGVQFSSYSYFNHILSSSSMANNITPQLHSVIVGALTGVTSSVVSYPFDILRTRFAANKSNSNLYLISSIKIIYFNEGYRGFFHGLNSAIFTIALTTSIMFGTYESVKIYSEEKLKQLKKNETNSSIKSYFYKLLNESAGSISGITSKILTFPLDTIRRRLQLKDSTNLPLLTDHSHVFKSYNNMNFFSVGYKIIQQEGIKSLFRGVGVSLLKTVPNTAINLFAYEYFISIFIKDPLIIHK